MDYREILIRLLHSRGETITSMSAKLGMRPAALSGRLRTGNLKLRELYQILDIFGDELCIKRGEIFYRMGDYWNPIGTEVQPGDVLPDGTMIGPFDIDIECSAEEIDVDENGVILEN